MAPSPIRPTTSRTTATLLQPVIDTHFHLWRRAGANQTGILAARYLARDVRWEHFVAAWEGLPVEQAVNVQIRDFVREHLAKHEVPRAIEFVDALPMPTTGKIQRRKLREAERSKLAGV